MNTELQNILDQYVLDQNNPDLNYKLAEAYYKLGGQAAACSYYIRAAELTKKTRMKVNCFIKMGYSYLKQGDRLREVKLMAEYARANNPFDPRSYVLGCIVHTIDKDWLNLLNLSEMAYRLPLSEVPYDEYYTDETVFKLYHAYALMAMKQYEEGKVECYEVINTAENEGLRTQAIQILDESGFTPEFNTYTINKKDSFRPAFEGLEYIKSNYSQAMQDMFVLTATGGKRGGIYLEIGSAHPTIHSNTALLEEFGWVGLSVELDQSYVDLFKKTRKNDCIQADAVKLDYNKLFGEVFNTDFIDYLQVDIDPASSTLEVLKRIISTGQKFGVVTFEHDSYKSGNDVVRSAERELMLSNGYRLIVPDAAITIQLPFEDWWIHKDYQYSDTINSLKINDGINPVNTLFFK